MGVCLKLRLKRRVANPLSIICGLDSKYSFGEAVKLLVKLYQSSNTIVSVFKKKKNKKKPVKPIFCYKKNTVY